MLKKSVTTALIIAMVVAFAAPAAGAETSVSLNASAAILVERDTGTVLFEKNADAKKAIASITKIMTMILVMEAIESGAISLDDDVVTSEHAYSMGGSQIWLEPGEIMTVDELLRAVAVASANDAAVALAEHVSGSEDVFVAEMNRKAQQLGMTETVFKNSNGLDEPGHLSSARDVAIMSREVLRHELVREYITIWMDELRGGETELTNTNKMLKSYNGITGIKTGTTGDAGVCISASAMRDGMELIAVVLGSSDSKTRFADARKLLDLGFAGYELAELSIDPSAFGEVKVKLGVKRCVEFSYDAPSKVLVSRGDKDKVSYSVSMLDTVDAPVAQGAALGEITVMCGDKQVGAYPITASETIDKLTFSSGLKLLFDSLVCM